MKETAFVTIETDASGQEWNAQKSFVDSQDLKARNVSQLRNQNCCEPYEILDLEIDRGCNSSICWESRYGFLLGTSTRTAIQLYRYHEIPSFLQGNPFIIKGYRSLLPFSLCFQR